MNTLIYDRDVDGHHLDYLSFLINFLSDKHQSVSQKYIFVISHEAKNRFKYAETKLRFHYLEKATLESFDRQPSLVKRSAAQFDLLENLATTYNASHILFMILDSIQIEIGKSRKQENNLKLSGIFFLPFREEFEDDTTFNARFKKIIKGLRKDLQVRWMLRNKNLQTLFILNDPKGVLEYNQKYGQRFRLLPDPIDTQVKTNESIETLKNRYHVPNDRFTILIYGSLSPKKNIGNILESLAYLDISIRKNLCILIAGEPEKEYESMLLKAIENTENSFPEVTFSKHFHFFDPVITDEVFIVSNLVMVAYLNFFNSSNVVGLAAKHQKPIIASKFGIIANLVQEYSLGTITDPENQIEIAENIKKCYVSVEAKTDSKRYLNEFSAENFSTALLNISEPKL